VHEAPAENHSPDAWRPVKFCFAISAASADPLGCDPLAPRDERSLRHLWRNSLERTDKTPASDAKSSQAPSFYLYLTAFIHAKETSELNPVFHWNL
jgi:hypothetical protein